MQPVTHFIEQRARLLRAVREYFHDQGVLEVTTSTLRSHGVTDPNLQNIPVQIGDARMFLQTSPEYAMKELLAETRVSMYQVCPAYRGGEAGRRHRIEFQMLEWYRVGFSSMDLADDVMRLLDTSLKTFGREDVESRRISYRSLFEEHLGFNPHTASDNVLLDAAAARQLSHLDTGSQQEDYLDGLFSAVIEPALSSPTIVFDYPSCQAALAQLRINDEGDEVADRFELYAGGIELGNAYNELKDAAELRARFEAHNDLRRARQLPAMAIDEGFLAAMDRMPACSGIAIGVDRLLMWLLDLDELPG